MALSHSILLIFNLLFISLQFGNAYLTCESGPSSVNQRLEFNIFSNKNSTGYWITNFTVTNDSPAVITNWKVNVVHSVECSDGIQRNKLQGIAIAPPPVPSGYTLYPGVGYYKMHPQNVGGFPVAEATCIKEGAHLAVVNSKAEYDVIRSLVKEGSAYLGFHDRLKEGEFITVQGQPLNSTGYTNWLPNEPNDHGGNEDCGTYYVRGDGGFNDRPCEMAYPFICEFEPTWV